MNHLLLLARRPLAAEVPEPLGTTLSFVAVELAYLTGDGSGLLFCSNMASSMFCALILASLSVLVVPALLELSSDVLAFVMGLNLEAGITVATG